MRNHTEHFVTSVDIWNSALVHGLPERGITFQEFHKLKEYAGDAYAGAFAAGADEETALKIAVELHTTDNDELQKQMQRIGGGVLGVERVLNTLEDQNG